ncbi:MAG: bifunctional phosphoserine phosphatase/homoserine phosphotransferase ThrH [Eggerthellaceae bacterium]|nr:bifunctional phosphoserine phosphatase/homoserine phosphotransferase ThrH [Eggerthellaceae bacterium]
MNLGERLNDMYLVCLDLEGVLVPEIWIEFSKACGVPELSRTTRDEPDYEKLMGYRLELLREHHLGLKEIQETIDTIDPLPGAKEFLDALREEGQVILISDTFSQFAKPLMKKLDYPTLFCNELIVGKDGEITGYQMRCVPSKLVTVEAMHTCGFSTIAAGDSLNDIQMIRNSKAGFLFRSTQAVREANSDIPCFETYDELLDAIRKAKE